MRQIATSLATHSTGKGYHPESEDIDEIVSI